MFQYMSSRAICAYIYRRKTKIILEERCRLLSVAESRAESAEDYLEIASCWASAQGGQNQTRAIGYFKAAQEKAIEEGPFGISALIALAKNIAAPDILNDKEWARKCLSLVGQADPDFTDLCDASEIACDNEGLGDRYLAESFLKRALTKSSDFRSLLEAATIAGHSTCIKNIEWSTYLFRQALDQNDEASSGLVELSVRIADDDVLGDKEWARRLISTACNEIDYGNDYGSIAFCYAHSKKLNDKVLGREWFQRAVGVASCYAPADFFEIAKMIASDDVLGDRIWARALCDITARSCNDSDQLVDIACFVLDLEDHMASISLAKEMLRRARKIAKSTLQLEKIGINIAERFPTEKSLARSVFKQAIRGADEIRREFITNAMEEYDLREVRRTKRLQK